MCSNQSLSLIKGAFLCVLLISFMEKQLNSEAKPSEKQNLTMNEFKNNQHTYKVEDLQETSSCTYVVEPVSKRNYRFAEMEELYDIKCRNLSRPCSDTKRPQYMCLQTSKIIYKKNSKEGMEIFTGCVCAYNRNGSNKTSINNINS